MDWLEAREAAWDHFVAALRSWERGNFSRVCVETCRHHCCDLADTVLKAPKEEIAVLIGGEPDDWAPFETDEPGLYRFSSGDCPHYDRVGRRCNIWMDPKRPPICREFPFGLYHDSRYEQRRVYVSPACAFDSAFSAWEQLKQLCAEHHVELIRLQASP